MLSECLHKPMKTAYSEYCTEAAVSSDEVHNFEAWCDSSKQQVYQPFQFWYLVLSMELEILSLSSDRSGKLTLTYIVSHWFNKSQQQCELRMLASHPSERHVDTGGETPPACTCIRERNICCTQIKPRLFSNRYR